MSNVTAFSPLGVQQLQVGPLLDTLSLKGHLQICCHSAAMFRLIVLVEVQAGLRF